MNVHCNHLRNVTNLRVLMASAERPAIHTPSRADDIFDSYLAGWAETDIDRIRVATTEDYTFHDPLVGLFNREELVDYVSIVKTRLSLASAITRPISILMSGPDDRSTRKTVRCWRDIPEVGLQGVSDITFNSVGITREVTSYVLNLASEYLRTSGATRS